MSNGITKINDICERILVITEKEFSEAEEMAAQQQAYIHPLKPATVKWQNELGSHNAKVISALRELQDIIREGECITQPI